MPALPNDASNAEAAVVILTLNSGSSSLKFGLYRVDGQNTKTLVSGVAENIGRGTSTFHAHDAAGQVQVSKMVPIAGAHEAITLIKALLDDAQMPPPSAIGHRIVHGGAGLCHHCRISDAVLRQIEVASAFAPLHNPPALLVVRFAVEHFPGLAQVACFDTAFHAHMPDIARVLPVSKALRSDGTQRYGFHGLSCESILHQLGSRRPPQIVIAHLGNGASVTAVKNGRSIDTSMGLTPTGGVIMGTRSGDLDPGVLTFLAREKKYDAAMLEDLVDHQAGLLGISDIDSDMRRLHQAASSNPDARLAIEMFCYSVAKQVAAMAVALGGTDLIVFTGGIGQNDAEVRARICSRLNLLGVSLDETHNRLAKNPLESPASRCTVRVLGSQEDEQIARNVRAVLKLQNNGC